MQWGGEQFRSASTKSSQVNERLSYAGKGGRLVTSRFTSSFLLADWNDIEGMQKEKRTSSEIYSKLIDWAYKAKKHNEKTFDAISKWMLDDSEWTKDKLPENEQILMHALARLREHNTKLRACLQELEPSGVVNPAVFRALEQVAAGLAGKLDDERLQKAVDRMHSDFAAMQDRNLREIIAGCPEGSMHATEIGYINYLKDCEISLYWTLFMPEVIKKHAEKINCESFEYIDIGKVRFIGKDIAKYPGILDADPAESLSDLAAMLPECGTDITALCYLAHHYGGPVDDAYCGLLGYFCKAGTPVPDGYDFYDVPTEKAAYALYASPNFDGDYFGAAYDFTRDQVLADSVHIPYPQAYWTAEVFLEGRFKGSGAHRFGYLFSVEL